MTNANGSVRGWPLLLVRMEGAAIAATAVVAYAHTGGSWWMFAALFLAPDASMLGYLANPRTGAAIYNAAHTLIAPALLAVMGFLLGNSLVLALAVIWLGHIGFDRMLGYGLKYATGFADTHLGRLGGQSAAEHPLKRLCKA